MGLFGNSQEEFLSARALGEVLAYNDMMLSNIISAQKNGCKRTAYRTIVARDEITPKSSCHNCLKTAVWVSYPIEVYYSRSPMLLCDECHDKLTKDQKFGIEESDPRRIECTTSS